MKVIAWAALIVMAVNANNYCLKSCEATLAPCQNNKYVSSGICQLGMKSCVGKCYDKLYQWSNVWAKNCTDLMDNAKYLESAKAKAVLNDCKTKAFKLKPHSRWTSAECDYQCSDASQLCNYTQWFDQAACSKLLSQCKVNCYNAFRRSASCEICIDAAWDIDMELSGYGCTQYFRRAMLTSCKAALEADDQNPLISTCADAFYNNCAELKRINDQEGELSPETACRVAKMC